MRVELAGSSISTVAVEAVYRLSYDVEGAKPARSRSGVPRLRLTDGAVEMTTTQRPQIGLPADANGITADDPKAGMGANLADAEYLRGHCCTPRCYLP